MQLFVIVLATIGGVIGVCMLIALLMEQQRMQHQIKRWELTLRMARALLRKQDE